VRTRAGELVPLGVTVVTEPDGSTLDDLVGSADLVVPSPGVPPRHPVFSAAGAHGVAVVGEVELASRWTDRPLVAVTGTNGKTTVTGLITDTLVSSGIAAVASCTGPRPLRAVSRRSGWATPTSMSKAVCFARRPARRSCL